MTPMTLQELFLWTRDVHCRLARDLDTGHRATRDEPLGYLLDYLAEHEEHLARAIDNFVDDSDPGLLATRVQHYLDNKLPELPAIFPEGVDGAELDQVSGRVLNGHNQIIRVYRELATQLEIPDATELLEALRELEEKETHLLAHQVNRMHDL